MNQKGAAGAESAMIIFIVLYILIIGWMANALQAQFGFHASLLSEFTGWSMPDINTGISLINYFYDFFCAIINVLLWIVSSLASFFVLIGYTVTGDIPAWLTTLAFLPIAWGVVWMIISAIRGR
jgi:hypothetical protein